MESEVIEYWVYNPVGYYPDFAGQAPSSLIKFDIQAQNIGFALTSAEVNFQFVQQHIDFTVASREVNFGYCENKLVFRLGTGNNHWDIGVHTHTEDDIFDLDKYTKAQVDAQQAIQDNALIAHKGALNPHNIDWNNLPNKPTTFPPTSHDHNDIYYTETEIDAFFENFDSSSKITISDTPPINPADGDGWLDSKIGIVARWYQDIDSGQWVADSAKFEAGLTPVVAAAVGDGHAFTIGDTPPSNPNPGDHWLDSKTGIVASWYEDGTSNQWIADTLDVADSDVESNVFVSDVPPISPIQGMRWFDSKIGAMAVWYADGSSGQWVSDAYDAVEV